MKAQETTQATHELPSGETREFTLIATPLKKQSKGEPARYYPWFSDQEATYSNLEEIFGAEMLEELAIEALNRQFQMLYFQRSPSGEMVAVMKDGKPATIKNGEGKDIPVLQPDETPRLAQFLGFIRSPNLSAREITVEYCARKITMIQTGKDKACERKIANLPASQQPLARVKEAMVWITKMQEIGLSQLGEQKGE